MQSVIFKPLFSYESRGVEIHGPFRLVDSDGYEYRVHKNGYFIRIFHSERDFFNHNIDREKLADKLIVASATVCLREVIGLDIMMLAEDADHGNGD